MFSLPLIHLIHLMREFSKILPLIHLIYPMREVCKVLVPPQLLSTVNISLANTSPTNTTLTSRGNCYTFRIDTHYSLHMYRGENWYVHDLNKGWFTCLWVVGRPTRWSLYCHLDVCHDHPSQPHDNREHPSATGVNKKPFACPFQDRQFQNPDRL